MADKAGRSRSAESRTPKLRGRLASAWAALGWEQIWRSAWPGVLVAGLFIAVALSDVLPALPGWLHIIALMGFVFGFAYAAWRGFREFRLPSKDEARRRIELASELRHRPLEQLQDSQATGADDPGARALWEAHRQRLLEKLGSLRAGFPSPGLARRDPLALRGALAVLLVAAVVSSWGDGWNRLLRAGTPDLTAAAAAGPSTLEVWLTPPRYTRQAPRFLTVKRTLVEPITVPSGTKLLVRVQGGRGEPSLRLGRGKLAFKSMAGTSYQAEGKLEATTRLIVSQRGRELGRWAINVVRDTPPRIDFGKRPGPTPRGALRIDYDARDDHGIQTLRATIKRADKDAPKDAKPMVLKLPAGGVRKAIKGTSFHDLTAHQWSGLKVTIELEAVDAIGQKGKSALITMILPERTFKHPVARALAEARKDLLRDPSSRQAVAEIVGDLSARPGRYNNDIAAFMAMRMARGRLFLDKSKKAIDEVARLLWDTALRIEDGRMSLAERDLRAAERALQETLNKDRLGDKELQKRIDELQKAIDKMLRQLAEDMRKNPEKYRNNEMPLDRNAMLLERRDLQQMLKRLRDLARSGNKQAAQQMLQALQRMLQNLRNMARNPQSRQGQHPAAKIMRDLQGLIQRQQGLMDQTFRQGQRRGQQGRQGQQGQQGKQGQRGQGQQFAREQEALRRGLGSIMRRLDEMLGRIPGQFGRAEREMRGAGNALRQGDPRGAVPRQGRALDHLRQGGRQAMQRLMRRFGNRMGIMRSRPAWRRGDRRDPFGRPRDGSGGADTSTVKIPKETEVQRAREIIEELRRRAGERERPKIEREYIDRLLRQF
ncbi:MAG TPA: TIGR02302 family protein [Alphaproteobacteria bacterium]|nr:TIGR02302 family protein [Alphaproteobacteria bacterium]